MTTKTKDVETKEDDFLELAAQESNNAMFDDMDSSTMAIPFLKLAQNTSKELVKSNEKYIPGLEQGMFFNTVTKEYYSEVNAIVIGFEHMFNEWLPGRGGLVARHAKSEFSKVCINPQEWGRYVTAEGNDLVETYVYYLLIEGKEHEGPVIFSLSKSLIKAGQNWNRLISSLTYKGKKLDRHYGKYTLTPTQMSNDKGTWFSFKALRKDGDNYVSREQLETVKTEMLSLPDSDKVSSSLMMAEGGDYSETEPEVKY